MLKNFWLIGVYTILLCSCIEEKIEMPDIAYGLEYFPLQIGKFREYKMDSVLYDIRANEENGRRSISYLREELVELFNDEQGNTVYKWAVFFRQNPNEPWQQRGFVLEQADSIKALRTEDHIRQIKMTFPVKLSNSWNGNIYIDENLSFKIEGEPVKIFSNWGNYSVVDTSLVLSVQGRQFERVLHIQEANSESILDLRQSHSFYAPHIGLIKRTQSIFDVECNQTPEDPCHVIGTPWEEDAERGYSLVQEIVNYN